MRIERHPHPLSKRRLPCIVEATWCERIAIRRRIARGDTQIKEVTYWLNSYYFWVRPKVRQEGNAK